MRFAFRRDVALGRFVPMGTPLHRLDPRTKLTLFAGLLVALFQAGPRGEVLLVGALAALARLARVPARALGRAVRALAWILTITFLFQVLWVGRSLPGGASQGAEMGARMVLRLVGMVLAAMLLTFTTEPVRLAEGMGRLFRFLEPLRVPVRDLAMIVTLALRFLPTVLEEAERIVTAQRARGARYEGGPLRRAQVLLSLAVPLFVGCLRRADTLALAMEARGFRGAGRRTQLDPLAFGARDGAALAGLAMLLAVSWLVH